MQDSTGEACETFVCSTGFACLRDPTYWWSWRTCACTWGWFGEWFSSRYPASDKWWSCEEQVVTAAPAGINMEGGRRPGGTPSQLPNKEEVTGFWDNLRGFNYNRHQNMET